MSAERIKNWFDGLEKILKEEANFAGLLEHGSTKGSAREFFVKRILGSFVPQGIHIGSGQIIGAQNSEHISKQVDIVIFDPRFPFFRSAEGSALYPIEGTIATIEVKSTLKEKTLFEALDNCFSVMNIPVKYKNPQVKIQEIMTQTNLPEKKAEQQYHWLMNPRTYIFGFKGYIKRHNHRKRILQKTRI